MADTARAPGHLFVVHGRLESVRYDAVVVPTDRNSVSRRVGLAAFEAVPSLPLLNGLVD